MQNPCYIYQEKKGEKHVTEQHRYRSLCNCFSRQWKGPETSKVMYTQIKVRCAGKDHLEVTKCIKFQKQHFPELFAWTSWCYSQHPILWHSLGLLTSQTGVQQGDPLGRPLYVSSSQKDGDHHSH